jgi:ribosomal protein S18 acetylase RimI-like enzyme
MRAPTVIQTRRPFRVNVCIAAPRLDPQPRPVTLDLQIRRCAPGDEPMLSLLGQASFLEAFAGILPGNEILAHCARQHSVEKYRAMLAHPDTAIWAAEVAPGAAPVGYLVVTAPDLPLADLAPTDLEVKRIYLMHRFQGGGLGRRLMDVAREFAAAKGANRLVLGVYGRNDAAIAFYEKLGYRRVGARDFQVGSLVCQDAILALAL